MWRRPTATNDHVTVVVADRGWEPRYVATRNATNQPVATERANVVKGRIPLNSIERLRESRAREKIGGETEKVLRDSAKGGVTSMNTYVQLVVVGIRGGE